MDYYMCGTLRPIWLLRALRALRVLPGGDKDTVLASFVDHDTSSGP